LAAARWHQLVHTEPRTGAFGDVWRHAFMLAAETLLELSSTWAILEGQITIVI
jgi:hypothetical protein